MDNVANLMSSLTDDQVSEYTQAKYPPSVRDWAKQEAEARIARRGLAQVELQAQVAQEQAKVARQVAIAKIAKSLEKVWTDDLTNIVLTREDVDDIEHGEEVDVNGVKEVRYPKVKGLVVRTNTYWTESKQASPKGKADVTTTKRAITVSKRSVTNPNQLELVGNFRSGNEACTHLKIVVGADSATRVLQREGYFTEPYSGNDLIIAK